MISRLLRLALVVAALSGASAAGAQTRPAPASAAPGSDIAKRVQGLVQGSGMTPEQIRSRLGAQGYSANLLDPYLAGDVDPSVTPGDDVLAAVRALGMGDSTTVADLRATARRSASAREAADSAFLDSISRADPTTRAAIRGLLRSKEARKAQLDSGFTVFGLDLFQRGTSQFDANISGAVDPNYRLGPGDRLVLFISGDVEKSYQLDVTREGFVVVPEVGQITVANMTLGQLDDELFRQLRRVYSKIGRGPGASMRYSINVARVGTNQIYVTGDVEQPGSYRISRAGTVLNALYAAGGPTEIGSMRRVEVHRADRTVATLDVYDYALRGDVSHDIRLETGDIVFVPPRGADVRLAGAVVRPATYELKPGETLASLLQMAGGFAPDADRRRVQIERILPPTERTASGSDRRTIEVASATFSTGYGPAEPLYAGDVVHVFQLARRVTNRIVVEGNVWSPGPVAFVPGMRLSDALKRAGGLKPDSYLGQVLITRQRPDESRQMIRTALRDTLGNATNDMLLADNDEITVSSLAQFRPQTYVTISGAVRKPGQMPYRDGMTLRDLIILAGGLEESALLNEAEIARLPENRADGVTARTERVPLDSSYVLGRSAASPYIAAPGEPAVRGAAPDVALKPYDAVLILQQPGWEMQRMVTITGEVKYPGQYALKNSRERLSDLIARAGGFTARAYPAGASFTRKRGSVGRVGLDVVAVTRNPEHRDNIELTDGDELSVPTYNPVVVVSGAVNSPVAVAYVEGEDIDYYIRAAGGGTARADVGKAYVTQANGKVESKRTRFRVFHSEPDPGAGSTVTVPVRDEGPRFDVTGFLATTASALGSLVAIIALARR